jgi:hypothetical protein
MRSLGIGKEDPGLRGSDSQPSSRSKRSTTLVWVLVFLCAALLTGFPPASRSAEKKPKRLKIVGITTEVTPTTVTIHGEKGEVTVQTREDFTEKVAVGSEVKAWYHHEQQGDVLQWLQYPLENLFVPRNEFPIQLKKVIILPSSTVANPESIFDAIANFMETRLGWYVAPRMLSYPNISTTLLSNPTRRWRRLILRPGRLISRATQGRSAN